MEVMHPIFFSGTVTTVTMKYTYILGTFFYRLQIIFHNLLHYQHNFPTFV